MSSAIFSQGFETLAPGSDTVPYRVSGFHPRKSGSALNDSAHGPLVLRGVHTSVEPMFICMCNSLFFPVETAESSHLYTCSGVCCLL